MAEIPQIQEGRPVLQAQQVNSGAEGAEAFAKTLGSLAGTAEHKVEEMASDQSNAMYINSVSNAEQVKLSAEAQMLEHPNRAKKIAEETNYTLDTIRQAASVNTKDRNRLNAYLKGTSGEVNLRAAHTEVRQKQLEAAFTHYANWPDQLKAFQETLNTGDEKKQNQLQKAMVQSLHSLVSIGAITPHEAGSGIKTMSDLVQTSHEYHQLVASGNATAQDYHTVTSHPLNDNANNPNAPVNANTQWMVSHFSADKSFQGVLSNVYNHQLPDPQTYSLLSKHERQHVGLAMQGVQIADGLINSGESYTALEHHYKQLSQKGEVLNYRDQATRNALGVYLNDLKNGNYLNVIARTPQGNAVLQDFNAKNSAIMNAPIDNDKKQGLLIQNKNNLVNQARAYGEGHHIPGEYIQPIPQSDVSNVESAFQAGKDPSIALATMGQYTKQNQLYLANAMKNPDQRMTMMAIAMNTPLIQPTEKLDFIAAQQTGLPNEGKQPAPGKEDADQKIVNKIYSNLSPQLRMMARNMPFEAAKPLQDAMIKTTLRYAKYLAQKNGDILMQHQKSDFYVEQASKIYQDSFKQWSGTNYMVNPNALPEELSRPELDLLADYVTNKGYDRLRVGRDSAQYQTATGRNPLTMTISPTGNVEAIDGLGNKYYSVPYTTNLVALAKTEAKKRAEEQRKSILQTIERSEKRRMNVRLPEDANQR